MWLHLFFNKITFVMNNVGNWSVLVPVGREINWDSVSNSERKQNRANWILPEMDKTCGVERLTFGLRQITWNSLEKDTVEGDSPVRKVWKDLWVSWVGLVGYQVWIWEASTSNPKYYLSPIVYKYREGKLKSTCKRVWNRPWNIMGIEWYGS